MRKARLGPVEMRLQRGMLQKLWYERPVRTQLLIAVGAINLLAAVLAGAVSILNTRTATRVEIEASLEVAEHFVSATLKDVAARDKNAQLDEELALHLKNLRHVRIMFTDTMGQLTVCRRKRNSATRRAGLLTSCGRSWQAARSGSLRFRA
jgi:two-component system sensor histidine kinase UhpB